VGLGEKFKPTYLKEAPVSENASFQSQRQATKFATVRLTSIYYCVLGYPELLVAPEETIIGLVKKI
jgi:hypothetical protein